MFDRSRQRLIDSGQFDAEWYVAAYPDVRLSGIDPARHFLRYGQRLGRDPGPAFSTSFVRSVFHLPEQHDPVAALEKARQANRRADQDVVLLQAGRVADGGRSDLAIALAEEWLAPSLRDTALLLRANAALDRDDRDLRPRRVEGRRLVDDDLPRGPPGRAEVARPVGRPAGRVGRVVGLEPTAATADLTEPWISASGWPATGLPAPARRRRRTRRRARW